MLLTTSVKIKWHPRNIEWYESKGYIFTKWSDKIDVKVEDLSRYNQSRVNVKCDNCGKLLENIVWENYIVHVHEDGKYYCHDCANKLFGTRKSKKTKLGKTESFLHWCISNLSKEESDEVLSRWDYKLNIDKDNEPLTPSNISFGSNGFNNKGYWFKCDKNPEHESELKNIGSFTHGHRKSLECSQCKTIFVTNPELIKYFANIEDTKKYSSMSGKKALMKCPDCGYEKLMTISNLLTQHFSCPKCGDGMSYPEKFMFKMLEQLNINFEVQLNKTTFDWCKEFKYDFYIPISNYIIETHGMQHYEEGTRGRSLIEEQWNDEYKKRMAKTNGIKSYVPIDCRYSTLKWVENNILDSELPKLLSFNKEDVDWLKCEEFACSSLVKTVCDLWKNGLKSTLDIATELKLGRCTVTRYLNRGNILGFCNYDSKVIAKKNYTSFKTRNNKKVICLTNGEIFKSQSEAGLKYKILPTHISAVCGGRRKHAGKNINGKQLRWSFYDKFIETTVNKIYEQLNTITPDITKAS